MCDRTIGLLVSGIAGSELHIQAELRATFVCLFWSLLAFAGLGRSRLEQTQSSLGTQKVAALLGYFQIRPQDPCRLYAFGLNITTSNADYHWFKTYVKK